MGRKDLIKHGGAFHKPRPKNVSNAFLAEEELEEMSAAGSIQGAPSVKRKRKMTKQEKRLRMKIREGLKRYFNAKSQEHEKQISKIIEEHHLRYNLRHILFEQLISEAEDPTTDIHDNTGINTLKDMLKNTNVLATLRDTYKTLTTNEEQKKSFRAHIVQWVQDTLAPVKLNDVSAEPQELPSPMAEQQLGIDILGVNDEDKKKFIDAKDGSEKETQPQPEEEELTTLSGEDTTGRNKAERIYPNIEKSIVDYYGELDNPEDQEMFFDYLIANLKLYFDKWDGEMSAIAPQEPTNVQYDQAKSTEEAPGLSAG